jgi:general secretion pathway protein G
MLIVLAILVALAAMVVPRFLGTQKKADVQTTKTQIGLFEGALERYAHDTKGFPLTEQGLEALVVAPAEGEESEVSGWEGPYLRTDALPTDAWGNEYRYAYPPEKTRIDFPDIWSAGPDGEDDTEDDVCSWSTGSEEGEDEFGGGPDEDLDVDIDVDVGGGSGRTEGF